jgi:FtsP/CotA-like multicopper oxidase with cupredoxin domain
MDEYRRINPLLGVVDDAGMGTAKQWSDPITETPRSGTYERWEIYNTTADAHPIHLHAVFFQLENRQAISFPAPAMGTKQVGPITLQGQLRAPTAYENGLKDTVICPLGQVTRIIVGFGDPGIFQWHCHILEHEDHEMMRPYRIT